jgi:hypothetical protein
VTDRGSPLASTYIAGLPPRFISSTIERRPRIAPFTVVLKKTDLVLPGRLPLALTRSYRSGDMQLGSFGIGGRHAYDTFLVFPTPSATEQLILVLTDLTRNAIP